MAEIERLAKLDKEIRTNWFKDHVAVYKTFTDGSGECIEFIRWGQPKSSIYCITYLFRYGTLFVCGDVGDAVYQWHPSIGSLRRIAGCNLDYFAGKCQASENGRGYQQWNEECAKEYLHDYIIQRANDGDISHEDLLKKLYEDGVWDALYSEYDWLQWLGDNGHDIFGDDYYEYGSIGMEVDSRCRSHLIGLQMAFEQIIEKKED